MYKIFTKIIVVVFLFLTFQLSAQDVQFSQFYRAPVYLNPALTGIFEGSFRITANYREQYNSILGNNPFRTVGASFDMRKRIVRNDYLSFGVQVLQDQAGASLFGQSRGNLSVSYMKQLSGSRYGSDAQYLVAGAQVGAGQNRINPSKMWFSAQWDDNTISVNQNADNQESNLTNSSNIFLDFNAGLLWYAVVDENTSVYFGGALNHLAPAEISLYDNDSETLYMRWTGHAGAQLPLTRELSILPSAMVTGQGPSFQTTFGTNFRYSNHDWREVAIRAGVWGRIAKTFDGSHVDAIIVSTILEMEKFSFGVSYDVNTSSLRTASQSRGSFEVSMIYVQPTKERFKVSCPKF